MKDMGIDAEEFNAQQMNLQKRKPTMVEDEIKKQKELDEQEDEDQEAGCKSVDVSDEDEGGTGQDTTDYNEVLFPIFGLFLINQAGEQQNDEAYQDELPSNDDNFLHIHGPGIDLMRTQSSSSTMPQN